MMKLKRKINGFMRATKGNLRAVKQMFWDLFKIVAGVGVGFGVVLIPIIIYLAGLAIIVGVIATVVITVLKMFGLL